MVKYEIEYKINCSNSYDLLSHLLKADNYFIPKLSSRVNLEEYSLKLSKFSTTIEAWYKTELIGFIALYLRENKDAFISNISVLHNFNGLGIGTKLIFNCENYLKTKSIEIIELEVNKDNLSALRFYEKFNFKQISNNEHSIFLKYKINKQNE